jgi:hypothetical protein
LVGALKNYFESDLYEQLDFRRREIQDFANDRYSWSKIVAITTAAYSKLLPAEKQYNEYYTPEKS